MGELHARLRGKQSHRHVLWAAVAARAVVDLARRLARCGDQIGRCFDGRVNWHDQAPFDGGDQGDGLKVAQDVPRHLALQIGQHGHDAVVEAAQRVAVRRRFGHAVGPNQTRRSSLVFDGNALAHADGHFLHHDACGVVDGAACSQGHDEFDGLVGVGLLCPSRGSAQTGQCG